MNFGEAKTYLRSLINRKDISDALASQFIQQAQDRIERQPIRPAFMQKLETLTPAGSTADTYNLPEDFLSWIDLYCMDKEASRVDLGRFIQYPASEGNPCVFVQIGKQFKVRPYPGNGEVGFHYYAKEPKLIAESDSNEWSTTYSDILTFGGAVFAAHHYEDERLGAFEEMFQKLLSELNDRVIEENFSGPMPIQPSYSFPADY